MSQTVLRAVAAAFLAAAIAACDDRPATQEDDPHAGIDTAAVSARDGFWAHMSAHCGNAYRGGLALEPEGDEMLTGTEELVVHFRECDDSEMKLPFHIEVEEEDRWDRSRTWVFIRHADALELRHDHRHEDGTEDEVTWYGATSTGEGTAFRQEFLLPPDDRPERGWRVEIQPNERYTYGTIREGEWSWRVDFDLSETVEEPPPPWGHETEPSRVPYAL